MSWRGDDEEAPVPLDPDLLEIARGAPANIIESIYEEQAERDRRRLQLGGFNDGGGEAEDGRDVDVLAAAYHEAGHACVLHHFGLPVREIVVRDRYAQDGSSGRTLIMARIPDPMQHAVCLLAGSVAELLLTGSAESLRRGGTDLERARRRLAVYDNPAHALDYAKGCAAGLVLLHRDRIGAVATELVTQLVNLDEPPHTRAMARLAAGDFKRLMRG